MDSVSFVSNGHRGTTEIVQSNGHTGYASAPMGAESQSPLAMLDDRLRGRWLIALGLGALLGAAFAVAGYVLAPVKYLSVGSIHVVPTGSPILRETPETSAMPRYDGVVATHAVFVKTPRVIDNALQTDTALAALPMSQSSNAREIIVGGLNAGPVRGAELIMVTYEGASPEEAQTVLNAVLRSYHKIHGEGTLDRRSKRLTTLHDEARSLRADLKIKRQQIHDSGENGKLGAVSLQQMIQARLTTLESLRQEVDRCQLDLASLEATAPQTSHDPTAADLEQADPELRVMRNECRRTEARLRALGERLVSRSHASYVALERELAIQQELLAEREQGALQLWRSGNLAGSSIAKIEQMRGDLQRRIALRDKYAADLDRLGNELLQLDQLNHEYQDATRKLAEIEENIRLAEIESEAVFSGSISIAEWGSRPSAPSSDKRKQLAAVGFCGGACLSFAIFLMLGSIDRRTYSASQLRRSISKYRCLGVLPDLGTGRLDPNLSETAVQCVHQIRNRIEALRDPLPSFMLVVTSPYQGDGKTSLSMALGWSYAAAGYRTLLMDCDMLGNSLSRQLGLSDRTGLREILRDRRLDSQVVALPVPNLHALGVGLDSAIGPESIRRDDFNTLCGELRQQFDVIIVDTGPFIGSIELLPVASAADSVVFSIRRGRSRARLDECIRDLEMSQVPYLGIVLNCAGRADCVRYVSKSSVSARRLLHGGGGDEAPEPASDENVLLRAMGRVAAEPASASGDRKATL